MTFTQAARVGILTARAGNRRARSERTHDEPNSRMADGDRSVPGIGDPHILFSLDAG